MFDKNKLNEIATGQMKELYERVTGNELRRHSNQWEGSCVKCGHTFFVSDKTPSYFYCRTCGRRYYAVDVVAHYYGLTDRSQFKEAVDRTAEFLKVSSSSCVKYETGDFGVLKKDTEHKEQKYLKVPKEPTQEWQNEVKKVLKASYEYLYSEGGKPKLNYLLARGFTEETLKKYCIGYNPMSRLLDVTVDGEPVKAPVGYYIPTFIKLYDSDEKPNTLLKVKVRIDDTTEMYLKAQGKKPTKYWYIKGSIPKSLFCALYCRNPKHNDRIIYTEGEFDAITINQCAEGICKAVTFGSHSNVGNVAEQWHPWLSAPENSVICFDTDDDEKKLKTVREHEQELQREIIQAQLLDEPQYRAQAPVIRHLPEGYKDWNDILIEPEGAQKIRNILKDMFGVKK